MHWRDNFFGTEERASLSYVRAPVGLFCRERSFADSCPERGRT